MDDLACARPRWSPVIAAVAAFLLSACTNPPSTQLDAVKTSGKLVVLARNAPTSYYETPEGPAGIEYDMLKAFADSLKVELEIVVPEATASLVPLLAANKAQMAAGLTMTEARQRKLRFGSPYQEVSMQIVYRLGTKAPQRVQDLVGREIEVPRRSSYAERLALVKRQHPGLTWRETEDYSAEELLQMVWRGLLEFTIADSHVIAIARQHHPELRVAFSLDTPQALAWAFPRSADDTLYNLAERHIKKFKRSGQLADLMERYYGPANGFDYINLSVYQARIRTRLPQYQGLFEQYGSQYGIDWRLLAAMGYQESYWDPSAISPTGVRGLMMLTDTTARQLGVQDRIDVAQSIDGGARYLRSLINRLPARITEPDRTWLALASYNVGIYHVEDARILTQLRGDNPDKWNDVKESLPLLSKPVWYKKVKYGRARGHEPVRFVTRVRTYYDVLVRLDQKKRTQASTRVFSLQAPAI
jgi:membrane-bound lytic murein transglycosylase F